VRRLLTGAGLGGDALGADVVDDVLGRAVSGGPARDVPGGRITVDRGVLVAERAHAGGHPAAAVPLAVPGAAILGGVEVHARPGVAGPSGAGGAWVRAEAAREPLLVRPPRDGDRIALAGGGHQPVGRLLQGAGVPSRHRGAVPVVVAGERILWVAGHRASADVVAVPGEDAVLLTAAAA
jgi:tRNA(Ile)-lysidine synthetase-like protein